MNIMKNIVPILFLILLSSCDSDDSGTTIGANGSTDTFITAKVNGSDFEAVPNEMNLPTLSAALIQTDILFSLTITGVDFSDTITQGEVLAFSLIGPNFDDVVDGLEVVNPVTDTNSLQFVGGYDISQTDGDDNQDFEFDSDTGFLRITSIDKESQTVSGEFEFTVIETNSGTSVQITEGLFNNIEYTLE